MPILSAVLLLLATSPAFAASPLKTNLAASWREKFLPWLGQSQDGCDGLLSLPTKLIDSAHQIQHPSQPIAPHLLMAEFAPWRVHRGVFTGVKDGATWTVDPQDESMWFEFTPKIPGRSGLMNAARTVTLAALNVRRVHADAPSLGADHDFRARITPAGRVRVRVPLDPAGLSFIIGLTEHAPPVAPLRSVDDEDAVADVSAWADEQFDWRLAMNPLRGDMSLVLPRARTLSEVVRLCRHAADVALRAWRTHPFPAPMKFSRTKFGEIQLTVSFDRVGLGILEQMERIPQTSTNLSADDLQLTADESARMRQLIDELSSVVTEVTGFDLTRALTSPVLIFPMATAAE